MRNPGGKQPWRWRLMTGSAVLVILGALVSALVVGMTDPPVAKVRLSDGRLLVIEAVSRPDQEVLRGPLLCRALYPLAPQAWRDSLRVEAYPRQVGSEMTVWYRLSSRSRRSSLLPAEVADANGAVGSYELIRRGIFGAFPRDASQQLVFRNFPRRLPTLELRVFQPRSPLSPPLGSVVIPNFYRSSAPQRPAPALPIRVRNKTLELELLGVRIGKATMQKSVDDYPVEYNRYPVQFRFRVKYRGAVSREWRVVRCAGKDATGSSVGGRFSSRVPNRDGSVWCQAMMSGISTEPSLRFRFTLVYEKDGLVSFPDAVMREAWCEIPRAGRWQRFSTPAGPPLPFAPLAIRGGEKRRGRGNASKQTLHQLWFRRNDAALPEENDLHFEVKDDRGHSISWSSIGMDWNYRASTPPRDRRYGIKFRPPVGARRVRVRYGVDSFPTLELEAPNPYFGVRRPSGAGG